MKRIIFLLTATLFATTVFAQQWIDVVYLENGSVVRGTIVEDIPNESLKIQTADGNVFKYQYADIVKLAKEQTSASAAMTHAEVQAQRRWDTSSIKWDGRKKIVNDAGMTFTQPMMAELIGQEQAAVLFDEIKKYNNLSTPGYILIAPMAVGEIISLYFLFDGNKNPLNIPKDPWLGVGVGLFAGTVAAEVVLAVLSTPHYKKVKKIINDYRTSTFSYQITPSVQPVVIQDGALAYAPGVSFKIVF